MTLTDFCARLPKAELHVHLEGTLERSLLSKLASRNNIDEDEILQATSGLTGTAAFFAAYFAGVKVLQSEEDFFELAWTYLQKVHSQNVVHVEMFFDPQAHAPRGIPFSVFMNGYHRAVVKAEQELGLSASLLVCIVRWRDAQEAMETLQESFQYRDMIIGLGLASDEQPDSPPVKFAAVYKLAREHGLRLTMHCNIDAVNSIEHIRQALMEIGVERIDHGTNIVEDESLVEYVKEKKIGLTNCPCCYASMVPGFKAKEILYLLRKGVKVTLNSDDPAYLDSSYTLEVVLKMASETDVTKKELVQFQRNAFEIAWIDETKRRKFHTMLNDFEADQGLR